MAEIKTQANEINVAEFTDAIEPQEKCQDCRTILQVMERLTGWVPCMRDDTIVGLGRYHDQYKKRPIL